MIPSEIRKDARESLQGNWGKAACITIAYSIVIFIIGVIMGLFRNNNIIYTLLYAVQIIITVPMSFGLLISFLKLKRHEDTKAFGYLSEGFSRFSKSWEVFVQILIKMIIPIICIIFTYVLIAVLLISSVKSWVFTIIGVSLYIACIVYVVSRGLLYSLAYYIAYDNTDLTAKECVAKSEALMTGNRSNLFLLQLSFIGWIFLSTFTLGIGFIWLLPYIQVATACFYTRLINKETETN